MMGHKRCCALERTGCARVYRGEGGALKPLQHTKRAPRGAATAPASASTSDLQGRRSCCRGGESVPAGRGGYHALPVQPGGQWVPARQGRHRLRRAGVMRALDDRDVRQLLRVKGGHGVLLGAAPPVAAQGLTGGGVRALAGGGVRALAQLRLQLVGHSGAHRHLLSRRHVNPQRGEAAHQPFGIDLRHATGTGTRRTRTVHERHSVTQGQCLPGACTACYFCINYPDFNPRFTLPQRSPPSRSEWTANLPYKARCIRQNI